MRLTPLTLRQQAEYAGASVPALVAAAEKAVAGVLAGEHAQRKPGHGEKFWQYREYTESDRPQDIDWRQSAKGDRLFVREKEWQTTQTAFLWCAGGAGMDYASQTKLMRKSDAAKILTMAFAVLLTRAGELVGLLDDGHKAGRTEKTLSKMAELLVSSPSPNPLPAKQNEVLFASNNANKSYGLASRERAISANCSLVLIGDFLEPVEEIERSFAELKPLASACYVVQVLDPAEIALPFSGRAVFRFPGGSEYEQVENVESVRNIYQERIRNHIEDVRALCRRNDWGYILHRTDGDLTQTLADSWAAMAPNALMAGGAG